MDTPRKIAVAIVMIIPAVVGGGALWEFIPSWFLVFVWILVLIGAYFYILSRLH